MAFSVKVRPQFSEGITLLPALFGDRQIDFTTIYSFSPVCGQSSPLIAGL